jgi:hypothetical protein
VPVSVTTVPPALGPDAGAIAVTVGAGSTSGDERVFVITRCFEEMELFDRHSIDNFLTRPLVTEISSDK